MAPKKGPKSCGTLEKCTPGVVLAVKYSTQVLLKNFFLLDMPFDKLKTKTVTTHFHHMKTDKRVNDECVDLESMSCNYQYPNDTRVTAQEDLDYYLYLHQQRNESVFEELTNPHSLNSTTTVNVFNYCHSK